MSAEQFDRLLADFIGFARHKELFVQDLYAGADPAHRLNTRVVTEYAWHRSSFAIFFAGPRRASLTGFVPEFTVVDLPSFRAAPLYHGTRSETVIACNFAKRIVLIGGTSYAGEIKKSVFSFLNYHLADEERHADALFGQCRQGRQFGGLLRALRHRQDDAFRGPRARTSG